MPDTKYSTSSVSMAAYLVYMGHNKLEIDWETPRSCYFRWVLTDDLMECVSDYNGRRASVEPNEYNATVSDLKRRMWAKEPVQDAG